MKVKEKEEEEEKSLPVKYENLKPAPFGKPGNTMLTILIEKIGLKDALRYIDPFITVSVVGSFIVVWLMSIDKNGKKLESSQDTGVSYDRNPLYVTFNKAVYIQTPINKLPNGMIWNPNLTERCCYIFWIQTLQTKER